MAYPNGWVIFNIFCIGAVHIEKGVYIKLEETLDLNKIMQLTGSSQNFD